MNEGKPTTSEPFELPWYLAYPIAVALTGGAVLVQFALRPAVDSVPFVVFFLVVGVMSWVGGIGPGLSASALSALAGSYFFLRRPGAEWLERSNIAPTVMFLIVSGLIVFLTGMLRRHHRERDRFLREVHEAQAERLIALESERRAREAAEEASRAKDEFLALLGHELRNPLAPIVTALDLLHRRGASGSREIDIVERHVHHLTRLVDDLLDVARITRGKVDLSLSRVEAAEIAARSIEMAMPLIEAKGHTLHTDVPTGISVIGDSQRLVQAIGNIVINAAKYTERSGDVWVSARRDGGDAVFSVRDNGAGMTAELRSRIFDAFVQGPRTFDRVGGGLGIGLSLARNMVRLHGGEVTAYSEGPGKGTEIVVRVPLEPSAAQPPLEPPAKAVA